MLPVTTRRLLEWNTSTFVRMRLIRLASPLFLTTCQMMVCGIFGFLLPTQPNLPPSQNIDIILKFAICLLMTGVLMGQNFAYEQLPIYFVDVMKVIPKHTWLILDRNLTCSADFHPSDCEEISRGYQWNRMRCNCLRTFTCRDWKPPSCSPTHLCTLFRNPSAWGRSNPRREFHAFISRTRLLDEISSFYSGCSEPFHS